MRSSSGQGAISMTRSRIRRIPLVLLPFCLCIAAAAHAQAAASSVSLGHAHRTFTASGCGVAASPGTVTLTPTIDAHVRTVLVHVPAGYTGRTHTPLVLNLHGSGSTPSQQERFSGMDATADTAGFIVAYPQGGIPSGSGYDWNIPNEPLLGGSPVPAGSPDDVSFLVKLVSVLEQRYCVDAKRVFATGFSGGARMASQLGCDASTTFAAIAPVSGLRLPAPCSGKRAVPVISFHGTADPVDPYIGHGQKYWTYSVPAAAQKWAKHDGCSAHAAQSTPAATVTLTTYSSCRSGAAVDLYTISGEGHEWPGGPHLPLRITALLGPQSNAVKGDALIWQFFRRHPRTS
jgi:polyhydroxybutyrate depolymerase